MKIPDTSLLFLTMMMAALEAPPPPASHINEQAALLGAQQDAARHVAALPRLCPHSALPLPDFNFLRIFFACSLSHSCARVWNEPFSSQRSFHVSMGTAASKRRNLRNDAISSVAAKVR